MPLDPQVKALLAQVEQLGGPELPDLTPDQGRELFLGMRALGGATEPVASVEDRTIPGPAGELKVRVYTPSGEAPLPAMVFFHGGGWVIGDLESHDNQCRRLANASGSLIVSVDYRRAPEHKLPAAVDDCYAAAQWVAGHAAELGADATRLGVGGDSAGGNLAAVVTLLARDRGGPQLAYQLLIYPGVDAAMTMPSVRENGEGYLLTRRDMVWFVNHYIRDEADKLDPFASPILAKDHTHLPPAIIVTAEFDPLRDEGEAYGEKLRKAGVPVRVRRYDGMIHGFLLMSGVIERARDAERDVAADIREVVAPRTAHVGATSGE